MSRIRKKRNKPYTGPDAVRGPRVTRYTVEERPAWQMWLHDNKKTLISRAILVGVALLVSWLLTLLFW